MSKERTSKSSAHALPESSERGSITLSHLRGDDVAGLLEPETRLTLVESPLDGIILLDGARSVREVTPSAERILGQRREATLGRPISEVLRLRDGVELAFITLDDLLGERESAVLPRPMDTAMERPDGTLAPLRLMLAGHRNATGSTYTLQLHDLSEENRTLAALRASEELAQEANGRLAMLVRASEVLASTLDFETTVQNTLSLAAPSLGDFAILELVPETGPTQRTGRAHRDHGRQALLDDLLRLPSPPFQAHATALAGGASVLAPEAGPSWIERAAPPAARPLLTQLRFHSMLSVPLLAAGRTIGALTLFYSDPLRRHSRFDVVLAEELGRRAAVALENSRLYELAKRDRARAEQASRAKDEFLAAVSHELRTPLTAILGWSYMLRAGQLDAGRTEHALATLERNARAQAQLIEDLLDVSRIITGKLRLRVRASEPSRAVEAAIDAVRPAADAKDITIVPELDLTAGPVLADPDRLQQIVWNLLSNAIKFTRKGGRVEVTLWTADGNVAIQVKDNGQGIRREFLPHVFEQFRQADGGTTRLHGGLGLGLAIARHLVELHGGTIHADSDGEGRGAVFSVTIPIATSEAARKHGRPTPRGGVSMNGASSLDGVHVLLVDDEPDVLEVLAAVLAPCGARVSTASSVERALLILETDRPDIVVSDLGMPGEDGYGLIHKLRGRPKHRGGQMPAVALTAHARAEDRARALTAGFNLHVPKPVEPGELIAVIGSLTGRRP